MGDDPIVAGVKSALEAAASKVRPKSVTVTARSGSTTVFDGPFRIKTDSSGAFDPLHLSPDRVRPKSKQEAAVATKVVVKLPESDKARELSPDEKKAKRAKRKAASRARRRNR